MTWKFKRGCWICNPFTVRMEVCPRRKLVYYELHDHTRFVRSFASLCEAQAHAEEMQRSSAMRGAA